MQEDFSEATLSVKLSSIGHNYNILKSIANNSICSAVVKANAYGLGVRKISNKLINAGCTNFFVAHLNEGIELRNIIGNDFNIFILHGPKYNQPESFHKNNLIPVINSNEQLKLWNDFAVGISKQLPAIIHIDTGMNRLGLNIKDAEELSKNGNATSNIDIKYIMSHLACASEPDSKMNIEQLDKFNNIRKFFPDIPATLSNSAGILLGSEYHFDMVRPGIALYGGGIKQDDVNIKNVIELKSSILQIRNIDSDQTVGYGATRTIKAGSRIATIPIGYADGYLRSLGNNSYLYIDDVKIPVIGRVSMDMIVADISNINNVTIDSKVEILGENCTINSIADLAGTISYEILTNLGSRYSRKYI